ncbi:iron-containing alcohol dehydrogenase [Bacillus licheniformis]|nr:iron-containing alcohol dehydrogenase [Bacillus licheniformis]
MRDGIEKLMESLILSGLVMLVLDHSRPASGGEHHLSHYLEMKALENNKRQVLHGAKVGCSAIMLTDITDLLSVQAWVINTLSKRFAPFMKSSLTVRNGRVDEAYRRACIIQRTRC